MVSLGKIKGAKRIPSYYIFSISFVRAITPDIIARVFFTSFSHDTCIGMCGLLILISLDPYLRLVGSNVPRSAIDVLMFFRISKSSKGREKE